MKEICALNNINISGTVFREYALLNFEYEYEHRCTANLQTSFLLTVPTQAIIRKMTVIADKNVVVRGRIVSRSDLERELQMTGDDGNIAVVLRNLQLGIYEIEIDSLPPCTNVRVSIECYVGLESVRAADSAKSCARLSVPFLNADEVSVFLPDTAKCDTLPYSTYINIEIEDKDVQSVSSPTYKLIVRERAGHTVVASEKLKSDCEFVLDISYQTLGGNKGYAVYDRGRMSGTVFYSICIAGNEDEKAIGLPVKGVRIIPYQGVFDEILPPSFDITAYPTRISFVARFRGKLPDKFVVCSDDGLYKALVSADEICEYDNFDLLRLIYGAFRLRHLYDLLSAAPETALVEIKSEIVKCAVEYQLLCEDAVMLCSLPLKKAAAPLLRADVPLLSHRLYSEFSDTVNLYSAHDRDNIVITAAQHTRLLLAVLRAQCEDGGFADPNSFDVAGRIETTALCITALCNEGGKYSAAIRRAVIYLLAHSECKELPAALFALSRAREYFSDMGVSFAQLNEFWAKEKAPAAAYARSDAEIPSVTVRGDISYAARLLIISSQACR